MKDNRDTFLIKPPTPTTTDNELKQDRITIHQKSLDLLFDKP
jgi:hypothetical protein